MNDERLKYISDKLSYLLDKPVMIFDDVPGYAVDVPGYAVCLCDKNITKDSLETTGYYYIASYEFGKTNLELISEIADYLRGYV